MDFGPHTGVVPSRVWVICFGSPPALSTTKRSVFSMPDVLTAGLARAYTICFPSGEKLQLQFQGPPSASFNSFPLARLMLTSA